ncbi:hypothetical protein [Pseudomonas sp. DY-1]|uniref:hypothetical protein n=1 Tax=Pseudomonas sp. DY-1 TaxID=1755504 RepID=UPI0013C46535|nr:hypothetical protein [Pseudomonas sp. DY-1]
MINPLIDWSKSETETAIALAALLFSFASLVVSWRGFAVSKRSLRISLSDHSEKFREIKPYLISCYKWTDGLEGKFASFAVLYNNSASMPCTIQRIDLRVSYVDDSDEVRSIILSPDLRVRSSEKDGLSRLEPPLNISAKSSISGWVTFMLPDSFDREKIIDSYSVDAHSSDSRITVTAYIIPEVVGAVEQK